MIATTSNAKEIIKDMLSKTVIVSPPLGGPKWKSRTRYSLWLYYMLRIYVCKQKSNV